MIRRAPSLFRDETGGAVIEMAIAVPILVTMLYAIFQIGMIFEAQAGMQHALGEAARMATIYPTPSDTAIQNKITSTKFGVSKGTWGTPTIDNTNLASGYKVITVTYTVPVNFLFSRRRTISLTKSKRVYVSA